MGDRAGIVPMTRTVYRAPTKGRSYFTAKAAAWAETSAVVQRKYPREKACVDDYGRVEDPGWHFTQDERLVRLRERLARTFLRRLRAAAALGEKKD